MNRQDDSPTPANERGICVALIYALVAERLSIFYEHEKWMTKAQGATLASEWLSRSKCKISADMTKHLSGCSDQLAQHIADSVSREAGLCITHEMQESLDSSHQSDIAQSIMKECERVLDSAVGLS